MYEKYVETSWCPADVKELTGLPDEICMELLGKVAPYLEDRLIKLGWEVLEQLIGMYGDEGDDKDYA